MKIYLVVIFCSISVRMSNGRTLGQILDSCVLRVGLTGDYAPYSIRTANNEINGADVVMANDLANYLGVDLQVVETRWKSLSDDLIKDKFDIGMGGISITQDRAKIGHFSIPLLHDGKRPIVRCEDRDKYTTIEQINSPDVRIITNIGGTNQRFAVANFSAENVRTFSDNTMIFNEIAENRADVFVTDGVEVDFQSKRFENVLCAAAVKEPFNSFEKAYLMSRDYYLKEVVDKWLRDAINKGVWKRALDEALKLI